MEVAIGRLRELLSENGRDALYQLFGEDRLIVRPDPVAPNGLVIEGNAVLDLRSTHGEAGAGDPVRPSHCTRLRLPLVA